MTDEGDALFLGLNHTDVIVTPCRDTAARAAPRLGGGAVRLIDRRTRMLGAFGGAASSGGHLGVESSRESRRDRCGWRNA
jgi:hypothetical protein